MALTLTTFGGCSLGDDTGGAVRAPAMAVLLLAYLYEAKRPVTRSDLAALLWPGSHGAAATNLRSTLHRLSSVVAPDVSPLIEDGATLTVDVGTLQCDLAFMDMPPSVERLHEASDAVAKQFIPTRGGSGSGLDLWVRDVRTRVISLLRSDFLRLDAEPGSPAIRSALRRAAILLLEADPSDDAVRRFFADAQGLKLPASPAAPQIENHAPFVDVIGQLPRIALLPPETTERADRGHSVANALIEDLTIGLCSSRSVSVVAPYTSQRIQASTDKVAVLKEHRVIYALDTKKRDDWLFVQLIFMPADEVIWAERIRLSEDDIVDQRSMIADAIQRSVIDRISSSAPEIEPFRQRPEAYFSYLRGVQALSTLTLPSVRKARKHFKEAVEHDKTFAAALTNFSRTLSMEWLLTARGDNDLLHQAKRLAETAIQADGSFAGGHKELGVSALYLGDIDGSLEALSKAEDLSPHYADVLCSHADSLNHGSNPAAALRKAQAAIELSPLAPDTYFWTAAGASFFLGQHAMSLSYIERMRDGRLAARLAAANWAMLGNKAKARLHRMRALEDNPDFELERWLAMIPHKEAWQTELYREGLIKAGFKRRE